MKIMFVCNLESGNELLVTVKIKVIVWIESLIVIA